MSDTLNFLGDTLNGLFDLFEILGRGVPNFVSFVINFPSFLYHIIDFIPMPLQALFLSFVGLIVFIIVMKVVSHFV